MQTLTRPSNVAASLLSCGPVETEATRWVAVISPGHAFKFSHNEAQQVPPLTKNDSSPLYGPLVGLYP